jgi:small subunit ribosomal protein S6
MDKYELVLIVDAALSQNEKDGVIKDVGLAIEKCDGKVVNSQVWLDKQKMPFLMKKRSEGTYYLIHFEGGGSKLPELRRAMKLNDNILRSLIIKTGK